MDWKQCPSAAQLPIPLRDFLPPALSADIYFTLVATPAAWGEVLTPSHPSPTPGFTIYTNLLLPQLMSPIRMGSPSSLFGLHHSVPRSTNVHTDAFIKR